MHTYVRGLVPDDTRAAMAEAKPGTPIRFVASTSGVARDKMTIAQDGWQLKNYRANPIFLWVHDYMGQRPPIGRAQKVALEDGNLVADVVFDQDDPFAVDVERKYRQGYLSAVSVGWDTQEFAPTDPSSPWEGGKVVRAELLDISAVPVPGDPKALMERQKRALADFGRDLLKQLEPEPPDPAKTAELPTPNPADPHPARPTWEATATAMVRLMAPFDQRPDGERKQEYARLARDYARHDNRVPPEFRAAGDLDALGPKEIRGLFLAGEPELLPGLFADIETRAGAVLSARNLDRLDQIIALANEIRSSAQKETKTDDATDEGRGADDALAKLHDLMTGKAA